MGSLQYRSEVDGLRAVAVLPVIFFHGGYAWFSGGFVGVDVFFVISGYLITTIIVHELDKGTFSLLNFYERRARRILPALFLIMAVCVPFGWFWLAPTDLRDFGQSLVAVSTFSSNVLFWHESDYFATDIDLKPLLHTWSLAVEEQYYVLFPLFLVLTWRMGFTRIAAALLAVFMVSLALAQWGAHYAPTANFYLLPTRGWELLLGVLTALFLRRSGFIQSRGVNQLMSLLGLGMIVYAIAVFDSETLTPGLVGLLPTVGTVFIILGARPGTVVHALLSFRPMVGIGLISYSAYLWHQPVLAFARYRSLEEIGAGATLGLVILPLVLAYGSWRWIEKPFRNREKVSRRTVGLSAGAGTLAFVLIGAALHFTDGGLARFGEDEQRVLTSFSDLSEVIPGKMRDIRLRDFDSESDRKVLLIGDSFAQDIANVIFASPLINDISLSGFYLHQQCGVVMSRLEDQPFTAPMCRDRAHSFNTPKLLALMEEADEVWLASSWRMWKVPLLLDAIEHFKTQGAEVVVFGRKSFGYVTERDFMDGGKREWTKPRELQQFHIEVNDAMKEIIPPHARFVDVSLAACGGVTHCVNSDGFNVYSHDGWHLTPYGVTYMAEKLFPRGEADAR